MAETVDPLLIHVRAAIAMAEGFVLATKSESLILNVLHSCWDELTERIGDGNWAPDSPHWDEKHA